MYEPLELAFEDAEWPYEGTTHERQIVRAIVFDDAFDLYFIRVCRDDIFGCGRFIETAGGGVEAGEALSAALSRELYEELGATAETVCKLGVVKDHYNLIRRRNINHYFLCRAASFGETHMTKEEVQNFKLSTLKLTYEDAVLEYERCKSEKLGRLLAARELPILHRAGEILEELRRTAF